MLYVYLILFLTHMTCFGNERQTVKFSDDVKVNYKSESFVATLSNLLDEDFDFVRRQLGPFVSQFAWPEDDERFDCVVAIVIYHVDTKVFIPKCTGVMFGPKTIMTSANCILGYRNLIKKEDAGNDPYAFKDYSINPDFKIYVVSINGSFMDNNIVNKGVNIYPQGIPYDGDTVGFDNRHKTLHDIAILSLKNFNFATYGGSKNRNPFLTNPVRLRDPNYLNLGDLYEENVYYFAGFGHVDQGHIYQSINLEESVMNIDTGIARDCDEYLPRDWGHFFCIYNEEKFSGISSGAPLFTSNTLVGIASFSLTKGEESILVFTNLLNYYPYLFGPFDRNDYGHIHEDKWKSYEFDQERTYKDEEKDNYLTGKMEPPRVTK